MTDRRLLPCGIVGADMSAFLGSSSGHVVRPAEVSKLFCNGRLSLSGLLMAFRWTDRLDFFSRAVLFGGRNGGWVDISPISKIRRPWAVKTFSTTCYA